MNMPSSLPESQSSNNTPLATTVQPAIFTNSVVGQDQSLLSTVDSNSGDLSLFAVWGLSAVAILLVIGLFLELLFTYQDRRQLGR